MRQPLGSSYTQLQLQAMHQQQQQQNQYTTQPTTTYSPLAAYTSPTTYTQPSYQPATGDGQSTTAYSQPTITNALYGQPTPSYIAPTTTTYTPLSPAGTTTIAATQLNPVTTATHALPTLGNEYSAVTREVSLCRPAYTTTTTTTVTRPADGAGAPVPGTHYIPPSCEYLAPHKLQGMIPSYSPYKVPVFVEKPTFDLVAPRSPSPPPRKAPRQASSSSSSSSSSHHKRRPLPPPTRQPAEHRPRGEGGRKGSDTDQIDTSAGRIYVESVAGNDTSLEWDYKKPRRRACC
eukprot:Protomagalhaensia_sp_Gyna_25__2373@NODE_2310_length_1155_cov_49_956093_g1914_i0_p1_GENE_NODE_2310_length_1155_cov_49_956093_g1914_i0NODE_2310_length_1155_cov_49_956093_g1914_i0_p1_ORF_typecomplete_len336_score44_93Stm1_N/PF09598_10/5_NODE_2310_length_1155_cov_49_956093_g1914_i01461015